MRYFQKLLKRLRERDTKGFTIIEAAVTIPMLALVGGTLFMLMAKSVTIIHNNSIATAAGGEVRVVMNEAREVKNCYQLKQLTDNPKKVDDEISSSFTITSKIIPKPGSTGPDCVSGEPVIFESKATKGEAGPVLFTSKTKVYISE